MAMNKGKLQLNHAFGAFFNFFKAVDSPFKEAVEIMDIIKEELMDPSRDCKKFDPGGYLYFFIYNLISRETVPLM